MTAAASSRIIRSFAVLILLIAAVVSVRAQQTSLQIDPSKTAVKFTLDAALHTVHGTFHARPGTLEFDPGSGRLSGEIVVEAKSGESGNGMRDRKMRKDVLESESYPEISFRPDRVEGGIANPGKSSARVHGIFRIHGVDREITVPAEVEMLSGSWSASVHFTIPYAKWGMRNPSTFFLRVSDSVEIDLVAAGRVQPRSAAANAAQ